MAATTDNGRFKELNIDNENGASGAISEEDSMLKFITPFTMSIIGMNLYILFILCSEKKSLNPKLLFSILVFRSLLVYSHRHFL